MSEFTVEAPKVHYEPSSFTAAIVALDDGIAECGGYVQRYATRRENYGWGYCMEAAKVALSLAEARAVLVKSLGPLAFQPPMAFVRGESATEGEKP